MKQVLIIAEAGVNHNGDLNLAKQLIDEAKKTFCDAIKFQSFLPNSRVSKFIKSEKYAEKHGRGWWIFSGVDIRHNREKKTWIEQFIKKRGDDASEE